MAKKVWTPAARAAFAEKMRAARAAKGGKRKRRANPARAAVHTQKFDRTVRKVKKSLRKSHRKGNAYAITEQALGEKRSIRKAHRRRRGNPSSKFVIAVRKPSGPFFYVPKDHRNVLVKDYSRAMRFPTLGAAQAVGQHVARMTPRGYRVGVYKA